MEDTHIIKGREDTFKGPSGYEYTIREQNGADDDILSNPSEAAQLKNIARFVAGIVVKTDFTKSGKLTTDEAYTQVPLLDIYCILFKSRIHSLGKEIDFEYDWGKQAGGKIGYTQDLTEFLHDYSPDLSAEEMEEALREKPDAIPFYPNGAYVKDIEVQTSTGKTLIFDINTLKTEAYKLNLPVEKRTKNQELIARKLRLRTETSDDVVKDFRSFTPKEMQEIRSKLNLLDPVFDGEMKIQNPNDPSLEVTVNVMALKDFFYLGEM